MNLVNLDITGFMIFMVSLGCWEEYLLLFLAQPPTLGTCTSWKYQGTSGITYEYLIYGHFTKGTEKKFQSKFYDDFTFKNPVLSLKFLEWNIENRPPSILNSSPPFNPLLLTFGCGCIDKHLELHATASRRDDCAPLSLCKFTLANFTL